MTRTTGSASAATPTSSARRSAALPNRFFPPRFNRYAGGGHYGAHVDSALMYADALPQALRSDLSATVFRTATSVGGQATATGIGDARVMGVEEVEGGQVSVEISVDVVS